MKPLNRKNYGSIPHLSNSKLGEKDYTCEPGQERILTEKVRDKHDVVIVTEKYDGSNVGIAKVNGEIVSLTRAGYEAKTSPYIQHHLFAAWVNNYRSFFELMLEDGERVCGEWLAQAHGMRYELSQDPIVFFDLFDSKNNRLPYKEMKARVEEQDFSVVRLLHEGNAVSVGHMIPVLNLCDRHGEYLPLEKPEGMVYRLERKGKVDFLAKWVRPDFETGKYMIGKERHELTWNLFN